MEQINYNFYELSPDNGLDIFLNNKYKIYNYINNIIDKLNPKYYNVIKDKYNIDKKQFWLVDEKKYFILSSKTNNLVLTKNNLLVYNEHINTINNLIDDLNIITNTFNINSGVINQSINKQIDFILNKRIMFFINLLLKKDIDKINNKINDIKNDIKNKSFSVNTINDYNNIIVYINNISYKPFYNFIKILNNNINNDILKPSIAPSNSLINKEPITYLLDLITDEINKYESNKVN